MSTLALIILITSAVMHATWNLLAKKSGGGNVFVWLYMSVSTIFLTPIAIIMIVLEGVTLDYLAIIIIVGSIILHIIYALSLQQGYKIGDFSLVYPVARGTGPFIVGVLAIFIFDEQLTWVSGFGIVLIVFSIFILSGGWKVMQQNHTKIPVLFGMYVGLVIASYTLVDKAAVSVANLSPVLYFYFVELGQALVLAPMMLRRPQKIREEWKASWKYALWVGVLSPLAYILVLLVMTTTPVSHVAPVRETSILIGTIFGIVLLKEKAGRERIVAAICMIIGVVMITFS